MPVPEESAAQQKEERRANEERLNLADAINPHSPTGLSDREVIQLAAFLPVVRAHLSNSLTPIEDCILSMADAYDRSLSSGIGLTPDDLVEEINGDQGCRTWFDDAVTISRSFRTRYKAVLDQADLVAKDA